MEILNIQRILIIQTAFIGDAILTLPMIQELKKQNSNYDIDVVCIPGTEEIFKASPCIKQVFVYDKRGKDKSFLKIFNFAKLLRNNNYSAIYSPHRSFRTALLVLLQGNKNTYAFTNSALKEFYGTLIKYRLKDHEVKRNLSLAGFKGEDWRILPEIKVDNQIQNKVDRLLNKYKDKKFAAIAPGSVWETKKYPIEYYIKLAGHLISRGYNIILIGGKGDLEPCLKITNAFPEYTINTAGDYSIIESIEILKRCSILICNDSAPTHMGMCADIPVITIYCSTVPEFGFYPYNSKSTFISYNDLDCKPCGIHGHTECPIGTFICAHKISINNIISEINRILV